MKKSILYIDPIFEDLKKLLINHKPDGFDLFFWEELNGHEKDLILKVVDYILVADTLIDQSILEKAHNLKLIQKVGIGIDNIDLDTATRLNIPVANAPATNATAVAELTILFILSLYRKIIPLDESIRQGKWLMWEHRPTSYEMEGKIHGIIGYGNIGKEVAKRSKAFGTELFYFDVFKSECNEELEVPFLDLNEMLEKVDILSCHVPLTAETKNLIGYEELTTMKRNAIIINVARGGIINEKALYSVLKENLIAGAALDVWEREPVNKNNPLLDLNNVIATPHIGAGTFDTLQKVYNLSYNNIQKVDAGKNPAFVVN